VELVLFDSELAVCEIVCTNTGVVAVV
jgi:hypothetical protein